MKFGKLLSMSFIFLFASSFVACQAQKDEENSSKEGQAEKQEMKEGKQQPQQGGQPPQMRQQPQQQDVDVSDKEIEQFSDIYDDIRQKRQETRPKMQQAIKDEGLTMQRFQTIMKDQQKSRMQQQGQGKQSGESDIDVSDEEMKKFKSAQQEVRKIQQEMQQKIMKTIEESDMDQQRFQEISRAIQSNPELRKKLQEQQGGGQPQRPQGR